MSIPYLGVTPPVSLAGPSDKDNAHTEQLFEFLDQHAPAASAEQVRARLDAIKLLQETTTAWIQDLAALSAHDPLTARSAIVTFGSFKLGLVAPDSDIDAVCVAPSYVTTSDFFDILVCRFQETTAIDGTAEFTEITPVREAYTPLIKLKVRGIDVDLLFASVGLPVLPEELETELLTKDSLLCSMDEKSARTLNGPRVAHQLLQLVPNAENFRHTLRYVKHWADRRGLYSNVLGFFGGITWALLTARVCQLFPNMSPAQLIVRFFKVWSRWDWPSPVSLNEIELKDTVSFAHFKVWSKNTAEGARHLMPIITPAFPAMNSTHNVSETTRRILLDELNRGHGILSELSKPGQPDASPSLFSVVAQEVDRETEHSQFLVIRVRGDTELILNKLEGFVESRLRFLVMGIEKTANLVRIRPYPGFEDFQINEGASPKSTEKACYFGISLPPEDERKKQQAWDLRPAVSNFIERLVEWSEISKVPRGSFDVVIKHEAGKNKKRKILDEGEVGLKQLRTL